MAPHPIIIDCDPGQDDAIALLLALASPQELEVLAITAVAGNVPLRLTEHNARRLVRLAGRSEVPVFAGCDRPLLRPLETAEYVHGETGLDGAELAEPDRPLAKGHAVDAIIDLVMARPAGTVTLCPIGPLTNIALALRKEPRLAAHVRQIVLMGGSVELGNVTPAASSAWPAGPTFLSSPAATARCCAPLRRRNMSMARPGSTARCCPIPAFPWPPATRSTPSSTSSWPGRPARSRSARSARSPTSPWPCARSRGWPATCGRSC